MQIFGTLPTSRLRCILSSEESEDLGLLRCAQADFQKRMSAKRPRTEIKITLHFNVDDLDVYIAKKWTPGPREVHGGL